MINADNLKGLLVIFLLLLLPLLLLIVGMALSLHNIWYYVLSISWFGMGLVFFVSTE